MNRWALSAGIALLALGGCKPEATSHQLLAASLEAEYGPGTKANVGTLHNERHLIVHLQTPQFAAVPDSLLALFARQVGRVALQRYHGAKQLDSLSVAFVEFTGQGVSFRNPKQADFSVSELR